MVGLQFVVNIVKKLRLRGNGKPPSVFPAGFHPPEQWIDRRGRGMVSSKTEENPIILRI
jgi:hypothetical protein